MGVVVERAPAKPTRILPVGCQLIVNASVTHRMLSDALYVVVPFSWIHVPDELSVEIEGAIGRPERDLKVVHSIDVFQLLRIVSITHAAGLARVVKRMRQLVCASVEVVVVARFIYAHSPQDDRRVIPITPDHLFDIAHRQVLPPLIPDMLPSRYFFKHQQTDFVAGVEKMRR